MTGTPLRTWPSWLGRVWRHLSRRDRLLIRMPVVPRTILRCVRASDPGGLRHHSAHTGTTRSLKHLALLTSAGAGLSSCLGDSRPGTASEQEASYSAAALRTASSPRAAQGISAHQPSLAAAPAPAPVKPWLGSVTDTVVWPWHSTVVQQPTGQSRDVA